MRPLESFVRKLSYANVMATVAFFVAVGGSAAAALVITGANVRNGSLTGADVRNGSLRGRDIHNGSLALEKLRPRAIARLHGARGRTGATGATGARGATGATGFASPPITVRAPAIPQYTTQTTAATLTPPSPGIYVVYGGVTVKNNDTNSQDVACGATTGDPANQNGDVVAGNNMTVPGQGTVTFNVPGLARLDPAQPIHLFCQGNNNGSSAPLNNVGLSGINVFVRRLD